MIHAFDKAIKCIKLINQILSAYKFIFSLQLQTNFHKVGLIHLPPLL